MDDLTIIEKQQKINESLDKLLVDSKKELLKKKVITPDIWTVNKIPNYISLVVQSEFEWIMNFHLIDSIGSPSIPNTGQSWYDSQITLSLNSFSGKLTDFEFLTDFDFSTSYTITNTHNKNGWKTSTPSEISPYSDNISLTIPTTYNFGQQNSILNTLDTFNQQNLSSKTNFKSAKIDNDVCTKCGECLNFCPIQSTIIHDSSTNLYTISSNECFGEDCNKCVERCKYNAISLIDNENN